MNIFNFNLSAKTKRWAAFICANIFCSIQFSLQTMGNVIYPGLKHSLGLSPSEASYLISSLYWSYLPLQLFVGIFYNKLGARKILSMGALSCAFGSLLFALSPNLLIAYIGRIIIGLGAGVAFVGLICIIADDFQVKYFATMVGVCESFGMLNSGILERVNAIAVAHYNWNFVLELYAFICFILAILLFILIKPHTVDDNDKHLDLKKMVNDISTELAIVISKPQAWYAAIFACGFFSIVSVFSGLWAMPFLTHAHNMNIMTAANTIEWIYYGIALGCPMITLISSKIKFYRHVTLTTGLFTTFMLALIIFDTALTITQLKIFMFLIGFSCTSYILSFEILRGIVPKNLQGAAYGFGNMMCVCGGVIFSPIIAKVLEYMNGTHAQTYSVHALQTSLGAFIGILAVISILSIKINAINFRCFPSDEKISSEDEINSSKAN